MCVGHLPGDQHSQVMMSWVCVTLGIEVFLPSTETGQSGVCMVNYLQPFLQQTVELETTFGFFTFFTECSVGCRAVTCRLSVGIHQLLCEQCSNIATVDLT